MQHLGDITKINGRDAPPVEVMIGGTPCQDLSVAGRREGLNGARSGLFMEQIRIIKEMRSNDRASGRTDEHIRPRFMVWENVPGAFSSSKGEDFRVVLEETAKVADSNTVIPRPPKGKWTNSGCIMGDGWSIAWRVLDAQFWGVPQRRRRIALVADFGGHAAPEVLFERESVSGDFEESGAQRKRTAGDIEAGACTAITNRGKVQGDKSETLRAQSHGALPMVCYGISAFESNAMKSGNPHSGCYEADTARTLDNNGGSPACNQGGMVIVQSQVNAVLYDNQRLGVYGENGVSSTITAHEALEGRDIIRQGMMVRRLTPLECTRLQGFPDGWVDIGDWTDSKGKKHRDADSPKYKALGNSIAIPPWMYVLSRLNRYCTEHTMASLFDGISGFCLIWKRLGGEPIWSSEIEEFPIAVCKRHFGDEKNGEAGDIEKYL